MWSLNSGTPLSRTLHNKMIRLSILLLRKKKEMGAGWLFRRPEDTQRHVRFASHLDPPYTDMDEETYFRKRTRSASDEDGNICLHACGLILLAIAIVVLIVLVAYFALKAQSEK
jgi:hypothetical protein